MNASFNAAQCLTAGALIPVLAALAAAFLLCVSSGQPRGSESVQIIRQSQQLSMWRIDETPYCETKPLKRKGNRKKRRAWKKGSGDGIGDG